MLKVRFKHFILLYFIIDFNLVELQYHLKERNSRKSDFTPAMNVP